MTKVNDFNTLAKIAEGMVFDNEYKKQTRAMNKFHLKAQAKKDGLNNKDAELVAQFFMIRDFA